VTHNLPSGTITSLFIDIEGSTRLLKRLGEDYAVLLAEHHSPFAHSLSKHGGREVDTQGDAFFVAFPRAKDAVAAAPAGQGKVAARLWPRRAVVRVRMGMHTDDRRRTLLRRPDHHGARLGRSKRRRSTSPPSASTRVSRSERFSRKDPSRPRSRTCSPIRAASAGSPRTTSSTTSRMGATTVEAPSSHVEMVSHPHEVTELIRARTSTRPPTYCGASALAAAVVMASDAAGSEISVMRLHKTNCNSLTEVRTQRLRVLETDSGAELPLLSACPRYHGLAMVGADSRQRSQEGGKT
jgi:hypothetical protein